MVSVKPQLNKILCTQSFKKIIFKFSKHLLRVDFLLDIVLGSGEAKINKTQCLALKNPLSLV